MRKPATHREHDVEGVQFYPESILPGVGMMLLGTWLERVRDRAVA